MPYEPLNRARITQALRRLGELALEQETTLEVSLYGGAVFTLVYGSREATKDVDAVIRQSEIAGILAARVARELELPNDWLNDHVKQFWPRRRPSASYLKAILARVSGFPFLPPPISWL